MFIMNILKEKNNIFIYKLNFIYIYICIYCNRITYIDDYEGGTLSRARVLFSLFIYTFFSLTEKNVFNSHMLR